MAAAYSYGKRRVVYPDACCSAAVCSEAKRPRLDDRGHYRDSSSALDRSRSIHVKNLAFLVIREEPSPPPTPPPPEHRAGIAPPPPLPPPPGVITAGLGLRPGPGPAPAPASAPMERTQSGLSISSDTSAVHSPHDADDTDLLDDLAAALLVRRHVANIRRRRHRDSQHGRILKALVNPKTRAADFPLDNDALRSIFSAANELFFANRLAQRVAWDWSHPASAQYQSHIVGTTALRRSARLGGYETLIVLSSPILRDTRYNRRLLISTFLHEMIHSFLFVTCGFKARQCGGHTEGFRQIAEIIDEWVGEDCLRLRDMEADLERFIDDDASACYAAATAAPVDDSMLLLPHLNRSIKNNNNSNNYSHNGGSNAAWPVTEWRRPESHGYPTIQAPQPYKRYANPGEWEWHDREGFPAHGVHSSGSSYLH